MKLNLLEKLAVGSNFRVSHQRTHEAPEVLAHTPLLEDADCLELGCGYGHGALLIKHYTGCRTLTSIDIDETLLVKARRLIASPPSWADGFDAGGITFQHADACHLPFKANSFDAAFHFFLLDHISDWQHVLSEVHRVLKPGGVYSFEDALIPDNPFLLNGLFGHIPIQDSAIRNYLSAVGFVIERFKIEKKGFKRCFVTAWKPKDYNVSMFE